MPARSQAFAHDVQGRRSVFVRMTGPWRSVASNRAPMVNQPASRLAFRLWIGEGESGRPTHRYCCAHKTSVALTSDDEAKVAQLQEAVLIVQQVVALRMSTTA